MASRLASRSTLLASHRTPPTHSFNHFLQSRYPPRPPLGHSRALTAAARLAHCILHPQRQPVQAIPEDEAGAESESPAPGDAKPLCPDQRTSNPPTNTALPYYVLMFTCIPCGKRSRHNVSKQGYHKGSVLITCPGCRDRHIISDHLMIFGDRKVTVEDLMREKGRLVRRGSLSEYEDLELWPEEEPRGNQSGVHKTTDTQNDETGSPKYS